jgi:putative transcriptional regulator
MAREGCTQGVSSHDGKAKLVVHVPLSIDVREIRRRAGTSQPVFAASIGVPVSTLRQWEHGRRRPEKAARVLLALLQQNPWLVEEMLALPQASSAFDIPSAGRPPLHGSASPTTHANSHPV